MKIQLAKNLKTNTYCFRSKQGGFYDNEGNAIETPLRWKLVGHVYEVDFDSPNIKLYLTMLEAKSNYVFCHSNLQTEAFINSISETGVLITVFSDFTHVKSIDIINGKLCVDGVPMHFPAIEDLEEGYKIFSYYLKNKYCDELKLTFYKY